MDSNIMAVSLINTSEFEDDTIRVIKRIGLVLDKIKDPKEKIRILKEASEPIKTRAQGIPEIGEPRGGKLQGAASATYDTPKLIGSIRAPRGKGVIKARYLPENLRKSIQVLPLKKTQRVFVGPRVLRRSKRKVFGNTEKTANAFYAQMVYGSARAFQKEVMIKALQATKSQSAQIIANGAKKVIDTEKKKQGFK